MIDIMWIWGAIGLILLAAEMATGTVYLLWFGISALIMAIALWAFPQISFGMQFVIYAALSAGSLAIWRLNYKKTATHSRVGQSQGEEIGRTGTVFETCGPNQTGKIRFAQGLMGSREWSAISDSTIELGQEAKVVAVEGHVLRVSSI